MFKVTVLPENLVLLAEENQNLLDLLREEGMAPPAPCGGYGTCKKCVVEIDGKKVLSCQTRVTSDLLVVLCDEGNEKTEKTCIIETGVEATYGLHPQREGYLIAFDVGTTTVVCYLLDPVTGGELARTSMLNPQQPYGADVISRIQAATVGGKLAEERDCIQKGMNQLIETACQRANVDPAEVGVVCVVGNPSMQQLFLGLSPQNLITIPFRPLLTSCETYSAGDYLTSCPNADLLVVPDISGYVGADTVGCVLSTRMYEAEKITLMVDIGTNGEMVLGNKEKLMACSTAAGPALEGAKIKFGMRGAPGAIDHVWQKEDGSFDCHVIGDGPAKGICGSGLIDAVACALNAHLINKRGRITAKEELDGERYIPLKDGIYLTQSDIREVQLCKGSIAAGIILMAEQLDLTLQDIDQALLAGAFGSFMDPVNACRIGLLPPELEGKITAVGNAAGSGSKMMASSVEEFSLAGDLVDRIQFLELADLPNFMSTYGKQMNFVE